MLITGEIALCSDFQYGFRSSQSAVYLLIIISHCIARSFKRFATAGAGALDISNALDRILHAGLLHKLKPYGISCQVFGFVSFLLSNVQLQVVLDGKSSQEYQVNPGVP